MYKKDSFIQFNCPRGFTRPSPIYFILVIVREIDPLYIQSHRGTDSGWSPGAAGAAIGDGKCFHLKPIIIEQGRIHGQYQLRTGGQGRKCALSNVSTHVHGREDRRTDGQRLL